MTPPERRYTMEIDPNLPGFVEIWRGSREGVLSPFQLRVVSVILGTLALAGLLQAIV